MLFNIIIVLTLSKISNFSSNRNTALVKTACLLSVVISAHAFVDLKRRSNYNLQYFKFWEQRNQIFQNLRSVYKGSGIVEFDDGIIAYSLPIPSMGGLGFTLDHEALEAKRHGELLSIAFNRGFNVFTSLNYMSLSKEMLYDSEKLQYYIGTLSFMRGQKLDKWNFSIVYRDEQTGVPFIQFVPKNSEIPPSKNSTGKT
ncbi:MAG TPA: hypothetical protein VHO70_10215 [Chitinispirillaceae bacterium]|nr:hypothetical protein [Chitinispirillaceae bacterium]